MPGNLLSIAFLNSDGHVSDGSASESDGSGSNNNDISLDPHCGAGTTWRDRVDLGWNRYLCIFFKSEGFCLILL